MWNLKKKKCIYTQNRNILKDVENKHGYQRGKDKLGIWN